MMVTSLLRKVALAPDSDDSDEAQATQVDDDGGSPPHPAADATVAGSEDVAASTAESGDTRTDSAGRTIAVGGGSDTEGTINDPDHLVTDSPVTDIPVTNGAVSDAPVTDSPVADAPVADALVADAPVTDSPVADTAVSDAPGTDAGAAGGTPGAADAWSGDVTTEHGDPAYAASGDATEAFADPGETEAVAGDPASETGAGADAFAVGFDGRPMPGDGDGHADNSDGSDESAPQPKAEEATAPPRRMRAVVVLTVLSLLVVGTGVGGLIWSRRHSATTTPPPRAQPASPSPTLSDGAFVTFNDPETGMSIRYPRGWTRSEAPVREIRLLVSDGKQFSALVRVTHTDVVTTPANLANVKAVTDGIVGPGAQILKQDPITVNGLIGYRYIYTLTDKDSGLTTAHLHYFLFQGHKMNSIVFEALPSETFPRIEGVFDQMLGSFHSDPEPP